MGSDRDLRKKITVLVNSCDAYEDLWLPFFSLFKKYFPIDAQIILNCESKDISVDGLDIKCIHPPRSDYPYGKRMRHVLKQIDTEYVLLLLDDFFLRSPVDLQHLHNIIEWMDAAPDIACFNSEATTVYKDLDLDKYPGFRRIPAGNRYTLNMQAAVWRTKALAKYWRPNVSPWEWELYCNALTTKYPRDKFYCAAREGRPYIDYGHYHSGDLWGIVKGKWFVPDVGPFFEKEQIQIDLSKRGAYLPTANTTGMPSEHRFAHYHRIYRCLGLWDTIKYFFFCRVCWIKKKLGRSVQANYFTFLLEKAQRRS